MDPETVAATSSIDCSREIFLFLRMPASALTRFACLLPESSGSESTRLYLVQWHINKTEGSQQGGTHVFRACGDSFMCPLFKGMMLPISRWGMC